jgi:predicted ABC-type ATPase
LLPPFSGIASGEPEEVMMPPEQPVVVVLGGINGSGKTTSSQKLLADKLALMSFVNADIIARGLNGFDPESVAAEAGAIMIERIRKLADERADFAVETTLAGRTYISFLRRLRDQGYRVELYYFWLPSAETAIQRVADRVASGGHNIPEATIRQRYQRSMRNFWNEYRSLADFWAVYHNGSPTPRLTASAMAGRSWPIQPIGRRFSESLPMRKNVTLEEKTRAIQQAVHENLREHALLGRSVSIWRDGKIVRLSPPEILEELRRADTANGHANGTTQEPHD